MLRVMVVVTALLPLAAAPAAAQNRAQACDDLWVSRNEIYKAQGYCFKTRRAIAHFGNAGCQYDDIEDVPLSANSRRAVADLVRQERDLGCPR